MPKIIQILHHSLTHFNLGVDPRSYEGDWHVRVAKELAKRTDRYEIECWRPEFTFKRIFTRIDEHGIKYRIFPSTYFGHGLEYSLTLLRDLDTEMIKGKRILAHVHGIYNLHTDLISLFLHRRCPVVAQSHGGSPLLLECKRNLRAQLLHPMRLPLLLTQQFSFRNIDQLFVLSSEEEEYFSRMYPKERARLQPMGINLHEFEPFDKGEAREMLHLDKDRPYVLYVGRLHEVKGVQYLIEALRLAHVENPSVRLIIVGDGPHREKFEGMSRMMGIEEDVTFAGFVSARERLLYYSAADLFVLPSSAEGFNISTLEALACKKPVITTLAGGASTLVNEFRDGMFVIPMHNSIAIEKTILQVLPRAEDISRSIDREKLRKYSWEEIIKNTVATYEELFHEYYDHS